jgi:Flp pilus assembly protein TadD
VQKGMFDAAEAEFQKAVDFSQGGSEFVAALGYAYAVAGKKDEAKNILERLDILSHDTIITSLSLAEIHAALGEKEQALDRIELGVAEREDKAAYIKVDPAFDSLRSEPRFTEILRKIGLEK